MKHIFLIIVHWTMLTLAGWLAYGLLRALGSIIYLGAPWYDWLWYLPLTALLASLPVYLAWGLFRRRCMAIVFAGLLVLAGIGYSGLGQAVYLEPGRTAPIPISFWVPTIDIRRTTENILPDLRAAGGYIYLDLGKKSLEEDAARSLAGELRQPAQYDIQVYLMPPLSDFLSVPVHREWATSVHQIAAFIQRENLTNVHGIIGDAEPPMHTDWGLADDDLSSFSSAVSDMDELIGDVHREYPGLDIGVTATWLHYIDGLDGDPDLARLMRSPVDPPGGWDFVNVMTYSSYFPPGWRAYYVYLIERAIARRYPRGQVSHLIGLVGGGFPGEALLDFDDLVRDARLSRALGVREIVVFQLKGALKVFGDDFVRRFTSAVNGSPQDPLEVPFSRPASVMVYGSVLIDALLDIRGRWGWLWAGWLILSGLAAKRLTRATNTAMIAKRYHLKM